MYDIIAGLVLLIIMWMFMQEFIGKIYLNKLLKPVWKMMVWILLSVLKAIIWMVQALSSKLFKIDLTRKKLPGRES